MEQLRQESAQAPLETGKASYYGDKFDGRRTASGATFSNQELTAAHKTLPFGTQLKVKSLSSGNEVMVTVLDRGPFVEGRIIDLSQAAFQALEPLSRGIINVEITLVDPSKN